MRRKLLVLALAVTLGPLLSETVTRDNFLLRNTQDWVELCSVTDKDPLRDAAIGFVTVMGWALSITTLHNTPVPRVNRSFACPTLPPHGMKDCKCSSLGPGRTRKR